IKREYSNARTPQQNGVAERKNRTLIEAARTMLADSFLPNTFWAEAVSTACYVLNRVLVTKPHNKTPYELLTDQRIMFNPDDEDKFWNSQQDWNIVSWKLHGFSGVHTLMTEAGLVIHMLIEKKYPLRKKVLLQMLELKLESEEDSTMALELIRFVKKQVAGLEPEDPNGDEEDL
ncbi:putative ribonuclease H-like domain-containing protein, partial [Tanacetum coccineum]